MLDEKMTVSPSVELDLVVPNAMRAERGARLALPAGRDDQHLARAAAASPRRRSIGAGKSCR